MDRMKRILVKVGFTKLQAGVLTILFVGADEHGVMVLEEKADEILKNENETDR